MMLSALDTAEGGAGDTLRWVSLATAAALMAYGLGRRNAAGVGVALAATPLAYHGLVGRWPRVSDIRATNGNTRVALAGDRGMHVRESSRLELPVAEVYRFWRWLENLPRVKDDPADVAQTGFDALMRGDGDVVSGGRTSCSRLSRM